MNTGCGIHTKGKEVVVLEDEKLLMLLNRDGDAGIKSAIEMYGGAVKAVVKRVLYFSQPDAEECIADTFIALWKNRRKLKNVNLRAWLIVAARNAAIDRYRKLSRNHDTVIDENLPSEDFIDKDDEISSLILKLPHSDKEIFIRKYYFLETSAEIARITGLTESDVNTRLSRGRSKIKNIIIKQGGLYEY